MNNHKKSTRKRLNYENKKEIIIFKQNNPNITQREISLRFNIPLSSVNDILKNKDIILSAKHNQKINIKNNFKTKIFDEKLIEWFNLKRKKFCTIQDINMKEMSLELANLYGIKNFKASNGWLQKFKLRHNIFSKNITGESGLVNDNLIINFKEQYIKKITRI
ncbi:Major centromere autoantigen B [Dictyocoela muelleri]|nr:Major centromere autoantigen B [Dictyocoela muelleri]